VERPGGDPFGFIDPLVEIIQRGTRPRNWSAAHSSHPRHIQGPEPVRITTDDRLSEPWYASVVASLASLLPDVPAATRRAALDRWFCSREALR
jgi:hypothetical protein